MSPIYERLRQLVLDFLPPAMPDEPAFQEHHDRVARWLRILSPLLTSLDERRPLADLNQEVVTEFLDSALSADSEDHIEGQLSLVSIPPSAVIHLPSQRAGYNLFYVELVSPIMDEMTEAMVMQYGDEPYKWLLNQLWLTIGAPLVERSFDYFTDFAAHVSPGVYRTVFQGHYETVLAFVTAMIADDEDTVMQLAPLVRQLPMGIIVGTCVGDPLTWYILRPGQAVGVRRYEGDEDDDDDE